MLAIILAVTALVAGCDDRSNSRTLAVDVSKMGDDKVREMKVLLGKPVAMSVDGNIYYYSTIPISERVEKTKEDTHAEDMAYVAGTAVVYVVIVAIEIGCKMLLNFKA